MHTVFPNMDCLKSLSVLCMVLAGKQEEHCGVDKENTKQRKCLWVLTVTRASMDVVTSMAASVILSLLLISGDVEENPGPGPGGKEIGYFLQHCVKFSVCNEYLCRA